MTLHEALTLCKDQGKRVRPVCWRNEMPNFWVEFRHNRFVENGRYEEICHRLSMSSVDELLGEWEVVE